MQHQQDDLIHTTVTSGAEVTRILHTKLIPALAGEALGPAAAAMIGLILNSMRQDMTPEQMAEGIEQISGYMVTWLASVPAILIHESGVASVAVPTVH